MGYNLFIILIFCVLILLALYFVFYPNYPLSISDKTQNVEATSNLPNFDSIPELSSAFKIAKIFFASLDSTRVYHFESIYNSEIGKTEKEKRHFKTNKGFGKGGFAAPFVKGEAGIEFQDEVETIPVSKSQIEQFQHLLTILSNSPELIVIGQSNKNSNLKINKLKDALITFQEYQDIIINPEIVTKLQQEDCENERKKISQAEYVIIETIWNVKRNSSNIYEFENEYSLFDSHCPTLLKFEIGKNAIPKSQKNDFDAWIENGSANIKIFGKKISFSKSEAHVITLEPYVLYL